MKKIIPHTILSIIIFSSIINSCYKPITYSTIPLIDFKKIEITDSTDALGNKLPMIKLFFKILDGDGNFGFKEDSIIYDGKTIKHNFFCKMYELKDNIEIEYPIETLNGKTPWVAPIGLNPYYKATIIYHLPLYYKSTYQIRFKFYVIDNKNNKSNIQTTMWIKPDFSGTLTDTINFIEN